MKLHRFIGEFDINGQETKISDKETVHQMRSVLRLKKGDKLILSNGKEIERHGVIEKMTNESVSIRLEERADKQEDIPEVYLYLAILKKENFELVAQKATELGVREIIPIHTTRVVKQNINDERVRKIIREAAEQSGRGIVPELHEALDFEEAITRSKSDDLRWFLDEYGEKKVQKNSKDKKISIFIGPEGGWTDEEKELAKKSKLEIVSISPFTLRAETAGITAVFKVLS